MWRTIKEYIEFVIACIACFGSALILLPYVAYKEWREEE